MPASDPTSPPIPIGTLINPSVDPIVREYQEWRHQYEKGPKPPGPVDRSPAGRPLVLIGDVYHEVLPGDQGRAIAYTEAQREALERERQAAHDWHRRRNPSPPEPERAAPDRREVTLAVPGDRIPVRPSPTPPPRPFPSSHALSAAVASRIRRQRAAAQAQAQAQAEAQADRPIE